MPMTLVFLEEMFESLLDLLIEKGIITEEEMDARLKKRFEESKGLTKFEDLPK